MMSTKIKSLFYKLFLSILGLIMFSYYIWLRFIRDRLPKDKIYRDVKADYRGTARGHFTIIPFLFSDLSIAKQYINNYINYLNKDVSLNPIYVELSIKEKKDIDVLKQDLTKLRNELKDSTSIKEIKTIVTNCNQLLLNTYMDPIYIRLNLNFTIAVDLDINQDYINNILPLITTNYNLFDIDTLFPKNNKINHKVYQERTIKIIETMFPEPIRSRLLANYNKFIQDHDK